MRGPGRRQSGLDGVFALLLFGVFAACVMLVLFMGTDVYSGLARRSREAYDQRTGIQYLATKVRQAANGSVVSVQDFDGTDALTFSEKIHGETYLTRIYCYDGWVMELFSFDGGSFTPEDGEKILPAQALDLSLDDGLLSMDLVDDNGTQTDLTLALRGEGSA